MLKNSTLKLTVMLLALLLGGIPALAQQGQQGNVSIEVTVDENGQVSKQSETRSAEEAADLSSILSQYGLDQELQSLEPGEEVEIIVRRKKKAQVEKDIVLKIDRDFLQGDVEEIIEIRRDEKRPLLGVYYHLDAETNGGRVSSVMKNTAAEKAGLQEGDVIIEFNGAEINGISSLQGEVQKYKVGDKVSVKMLRGDATITKKVILGENNGEVNNTDRIENFEFHMPRNGNSFHWNSNGSNVEVDNSRPMLGVHVGAKVVVINGEEIENTEAGEGVYISGVIDGTAAAEAGLQEGDRVLSINGATVGNRVGIGEVLKQYKVGDKIDIVYLRDEQRQEGSATLTGWKSAPQNQHFEFNFDFDEEDMELEEVKEIMERMERREEEARVVSTRDFRMVIRMEDVTTAEAEALSARSGEDFAGQSNLSLDYLKVGPNPSNGMFSFSFELASQGRTDIRVLDTNGNLVYEEELGDFSGRYDKEFDISNFAKGIYYLQINQEGKAFTKKIVTQ